MKIWIIEFVGHANDGLALAGSRLDGGAFIECICYANIVAKVGRLCNVRTVIMKSLQKYAYSKWLGGGGEGICYNAVSMAKMVNKNKLK